MTSNLERRSAKELDADDPDVTVVSMPEPVLSSSSPVPVTVRPGDPPEPAAPLQSRESADQGLVGERFGKYLLVGELAHGGMAELFLAVHQGVEDFLKVVALKRVLPHLSNTKSFTRMFIEEARLAARIEHPNIVRTYEFGEYGGQYYSVMEYLPGEDLVKMMNRLAKARRAMSFDMAASIVSQVCCGLHFAHQFTDLDGRPLGLVHRDVSPANVVVTYTGEVKLIDFGVAKSSTNASTTAGAIKGKVAYMSPEQVLAGPVDCRSDVFAAGIVLWELITGRPLFTRDSEASTLYAVMSDPIPAPETVRRDVPPELSAIVMRALSRAAEDRFQSAELMQGALDDFLSGRPKQGNRTLASTVEQLFGRERARAKQAIAQSRSLTTNVSLVMKLRGETTTGVTRIEAVGTPAPIPAGDDDAGPASSRGGRVMLAAMIAGVLAVGGGLVAIAQRDSSGAATAPAAATSTALTVESTPPGAAIFIAGEPTGRVTPAVLTGLRAGALALRVELAGYTAGEASLTVAPGDRLTQRFALEVRVGRLIVTGLPPGATVIVAGGEYPAGQLISLREGRHDVVVVVNGQPVTQQLIDTTIGDQTWELRGDELVRN